MSELAATITTYGCDALRPSLGKIFNAPSSIGRVLYKNHPEDAAWNPAGTCFQVSDQGLIVTAAHVVEGVVQDSAAIVVDAINNSQGPSLVHVLEIDDASDIALLRRDPPLDGVIKALAPTDNVPLITDVFTVGTGILDARDYDYRYITAVGKWRGLAVRNNNQQIGQMDASGVLLGMSGSPVFRTSDEVVVGMIIARYDTPENWYRDTVLVSRTEDIVELLRKYPNERIGDVTGRFNLEQSNRIGVFLCHSSGDKARVRDLYHKLQADGVQCWLDEEQLLPGQDWDREIRIALQKCRFVIALLSDYSTTKSGFVQTELRRALNMADQQPDGSIFLIPARLEPCQIPERLSHLHCVDLFRSDGYERLLKALRSIR